MEIICYACGRGEFPENTLEAITHCQKVNPAWRIEMDLQMTKDGEIILFHDDNTLRTTGKSLRVRETTLSEITQLNAGFNFAINHGNRSQQTSFQIPTLRQVLEQFEGIQLLLDVHTSDLKAVDPILALIKEFKMEKHVVLVSKYDHIVAASREKNPGLTYGVASKEAKKLIYSSFLKLDSLFPIKGDILMIPLSFGKLTVLTNRIVSHVQKRAKKIWAWMEEGQTVETVNSVAELNQLKETGAQGIFTEYPEKLASELS